MARESIYGRLLEAQKQWLAAESGARKRKEKRDAEIRYLREQGVPASKIANELGISRQAVTQIAKA